MADEKIEELREICLAPDPVEIYDQPLWDSYIQTVRAYFIEQGHTDPDQPLIGLSNINDYSFQEVEHEPFVEGRLIDKSKVLIFQGQRVARIQNYSITVREGPYPVGGDCMTKFPGHIFGYVKGDYE